MKLSTVLLRLLLILAAALVVLPLLWTLLNAFKTNADLLVSTPKLVFQPVWDNMSYVLNRRSVARALANSLIICSSAVLIGAVIGVPAAYVIARFKNRLTAQGLEIVGNTQEQMLALMHADTKKWLDVIHKTGVKIQ